MCGIAGIYNLDPARVDAPALCRMTERLRHRGPDDEGYVLIDTRAGEAQHAGGKDTQAGLSLPRVAEVDARSANLGMGHRRLAIIDTSASGHQPMSNRDGSLWLVYNGEVHNYVELRLELQDAGYTFRTHTDTEVVLAAYEEWGVECLRRFNGMWAFALWDGRRGRLFCATDRFGIKPFYYWRGDGCFVFASEPKALLCHSRVPRRPNPQAIFDYLAWGRTSHGSGTFFADVKCLPASHHLVLDAGGACRVERWWGIEPSLAVTGGSIDEDEAKERVTELLTDAVRIRLRTDVPVGTCLSGGLDSSTIVCMANSLIFGEGAVDRRLVGDKQKTFSSCAHDARFDEREFIARVAEHTGVEEHHVFPTGADLWRDLPRLVWQQDEPFGSTSVYAQWRVMERAAGARVKVLLDGQGADEVLAGYPSYYPVLFAHLARSGRVLRAAREARRAASLAPRSARRDLAGTLYYLASPRLMLAARRLLGRALGVQSQAAVAALQDSFREQAADAGLARLRGQHQAASSLHTHLLDQIFDASLPHLLRYEDRNSMAFAIESRLPFLDHRLVEYLFSLPVDFKMRDGWTKWILRQSTERVLPEAIRWRRDKMGFVTPGDTWLMENRDEVRSLFDGEPMSAEYVRPQAVRAALDGLHDAPRPGRRTLVWQWLNLELWLRAFFGEGAGGPP